MLWVNLRVIISIVIRSIVNRHHHSLSLMYSVGEGVRRGTSIGAIELDAEVIVGSACRVFSVLLEYYPAA